MDLFWIISGLVILGLVGFGLQILSVRLVTHSKWNDEEIQNPSTYCPPISILKPLSGLDDHLFGNLESFCLQDYPVYEILFSFQDHNDPAYRVVQKLKDKYPNCDISLIVEECREGWNPKVNNMIPAYRQAKYPYLLISDSNVMVEPGYLRKVIQPMKDSGVGLVTNLIRGVGAKSIGSLFENLHLNSFVLGNVCFLKKFLNIPCVIGKSMLMRKSDLEALGGLKEFKDVLAEDHFIGEKIKERGQQVILSTEMINNVNEYWGLKKFLNRHLRWGKMRWKIMGYKYVSELFGNPVLLSILPLISEGPTERSLILASAASFIKGVGDLYIGKRISANLHPLGYLLAPLKDILMGILWFFTVSNSTILWRGNRLEIGKNTVLFPSSSYENEKWMWKGRLIERIRTRIAW